MHREISNVVKRALGKDLQVVSNTGGAANRKTLYLINLVLAITLK
jgi:hypothetical protein